MLYEGMNAIISVYMDGDSQAWITNFFYTEKDTSKFTLHLLILL